jgi:hypothetical protein
MTAIGFVGEDEQHFWVVTTLVDDALLASVDWLRDVIESCRVWQGLHAGERWHKYSLDDAYDLRPVSIRGVVIKPQGWIAGAPLKPEAGMWRRVLLQFVHADPRPDIVVLVRDVDGYAERLDGIEQVRRGFPWPFQIVAAMPEPEIEGWIVSGFSPADAGERTTLEELRRQLSFDPTAQSHRLTAHPNDAAADAKRVLARLSGEDRDRQRACLERDVVYARGERNGARRFLDEVDQRVVPMFVRRP